MSTNKIPEDERLGKMLGQWKVEAPLPPRFQEQVWQRIAQAETRSESAGWAGVWRLIDVVLPRPKFAFAYMAVLLAAGVAAGSVAAQMKSSRLDTELGLRYVQSIDPYQPGASQP